ncbi:hypothetical protein [Odoribacter laneus]|uniref:hypothetical protein n=1 Tax=Odoribacter laneus TaxID=626933 RepID=UPI003FF02C18
MNKLVKRGLLIVIVLVILGIIFIPRLDWFNVTSETPVVSGGTEHGRGFARERNYC